MDILRAWLNGNARNTDIPLGSVGRGGTDPTIDPQYTKHVSWYYRTEGNGWTRFNWCHSRHDALGRMKYDKQVDPRWKLVGPYPIPWRKNERFH